MHDLGLSSPSSYLMDLSKKLADTVSGIHYDITKALKNNFRDFKMLMCQYKFISEHVRDREDMTSNQVMDDFKHSLRLKKDLKDYPALQDSCTKFLSILQDLGPPAADLVEGLRLAWNDTAREYGPHKESVFLPVPHQEETDLETDTPSSMPVSSSDTELLTLHQRQRPTHSNTAPARLLKPRSTDESSQSSGNTSRDVTSATSPIYMTPQTVTQESDPSLNYSKTIPPTEVGKMTNINPNTVHPTAETRPYHQCPATDPAVQVHDYFPHSRGVYMVKEREGVVEDNINKLRKKVEKCTDEVKNSQISAKYCNDEIKKQLKTIKSAQEKHTKSQESVNVDLKDQLRSIKLTTDDLREQLKSIKSTSDEHIRSLESVIHELKDEIRSMKSANNELREQIKEKAQLKKEQMQLEEKEKEIKKQRSKAERQSELLTQKESRVKELEKEAKARLDTSEKSLRKRERDIDQKLTSIVQSGLQQHHSDCDKLLNDAKKDMHQTLADNSRHLNRYLHKALIVLVIGTTVAAILIIFVSHF